MRIGTLCGLPALVFALSLGACAGKAPPGNGDDDGDDDTSGPNIDAGVPSTPDAGYEACAESDPGAFTFEKIAKWRDDAKAAYSFIHDDFCDNSVRGIWQYGIPQLVARGLHAGIGVIAETCAEDGGWDKLVASEQMGMEVVDHSSTHPQITTENMQHEVAEAKSLLDQHAKHPVTFFIFPYDFFSPETIAKVSSVGHIGARAGNRDDNDGFDNPPINGAEPDNDLAVEFDVWPRSFSKYALYFPQDMLQVHVWNAIEKGGWAMREFHSVIPDDEPVATNGFGPVPLSIYTKHLDFLQKAWETNQVWTGTPTEVIRYRHARKACKASVTGSTIKFDSSAGDCKKFATPISVIVKTENDVPRVDGTQGGAQVATRKIGPSTFSITADPTKGDVTLSGCSNEGPTVLDEPLEPKPAAANSVCDIQKEVGSGDNGKMDDLERPMDEFQALPNPSQHDKRDGTWSWYPQTAKVVVGADGSNHFVHYTGTALNAWTGVTLAFLNSNGAGACYDASVYHGIRFKIKGRVNDTMLNNKVIVSLVTAETQTRTYGGDLVGEGGHFNKQVTVTSSWQTVSIAWADFDKPTWGATTSLPALAKSKLQAIDWGIANTASSFDISLDDIELY
jgi:Polysaccharide deacetylase